MPYKIRPSGGTAGRFTSGEDPSGTLTLEDIDRPLDRSKGQEGFIVRGTDNAGDTVRKIKPESSAKVELPTFSDGKLTWTPMDIVSHIGGAAREEILSPKESEVEIGASISPQATVFNTLAADGLTQPLFEIAMAVMAAEEMRRPGFMEDIEDANARLALAGKLDESDEGLSPAAIKVIMGGEEFNAQGPLDTARADLPALQQAGFKGVSIRPTHGRVNIIRRKAMANLLRMEAPEGFAKTLDDVLMELRKASVDAVCAVMAAHNATGIFRNWASWLYLTVAMGRPVDILNVSGDWLTGMTSAGTRFTGSGSQLSYPPNVYMLEQFVTAPQAADQSRALRDLILLDDVTRPEDMRSIGMSAVDLRVMIHANLAARTFEDLISTTDSFGRGTFEEWGQFVCLYAGHLALPMGAGIYLEVSTAAAAAAARLALDARPIAEGEVVSGAARAPVSRDGRLLAAHPQDGRQVLSLKGPVQRDIAVDNLKIISDLVKPAINLPVKIDNDPDNLAAHRAYTVYIAAEAGDNTTPFQFQSGARIRNEILAVIDRYLRNSVLNRVIDGTLIRDETKVLNKWLESLDSPKSQRLIDGKGSKIMLKHEAGKLTADVTLSYLPTVETVAINHIPVQAQLEYETGQQAGANDAA